LIVLLTVDVEHDCPPYLGTARGIAEGLPILLNLRRSHRVKATFYVTGEVARGFPEAVKEIYGAGHELGCHGYAHERMDRLTTLEAERRVARASKASYKPPFQKGLRWRGGMLLAPVSITSSALRLPFRMVENLEQVIQFYREMGAEFLTMRELYVEVRREDHDSLYPLSLSISPSPKVMVL